MWKAGRCCAVRIGARTRILGPVTTWMIYSSRSNNILLVSVEQLVGSADCKSVLFGAWGFESLH
jgi:hypothetical protein